ncbi:hypothetical protein [Thermocrinis sp.]|jgi:hypothetical protein|uniref:hypothetical protein n=1 Tax=Thermocrinis sp. TaxID=2024383 RepID=UPI003BFEA939
MLVFYPRRSGWSKPCRYSIAEMLDVAAKLREFILCSAYLEVETDEEAALLEGVLPLLEPPFREEVAKVLDAYWTAKRILNELSRS